MAGKGFRPARGHWELVLLPTASAATFQQWAPVTFDGARNLIEAASDTTYIVGVATSYSTASFPAGYVTVAMPADGTAVARGNVPTGVASSALSYGAAYGITKSVNNLYINTSSQASALVELRGNFDSTTSEIDVQFLTESRAVPSRTSSQFSTI